MSGRKTFGLILLGQLCLLAVLGWHFRYALNPDGVAYLRLAHYYAQGNFDLAVSGYWGPLLSWLMALGLKLGLPPLETARSVMAVSALVFVWGAQRIYEELFLPPAWRVGGLVLAAIASAWWSVQFITPDLLLAGVWLLALSQMVRSDWSTSRRRALVAGGLWGVAYLIKAIALPLGVFVVLMFGIRAVTGTPGRARVVTQSVVCSLLAMGLVALPWIAVLSAKYERLTFSTTPTITHTLTGPPDVDRYHPFARKFQPPETGRITSWEEPSRQQYQTWSPLANAAYAGHQVRVLLRNTVTIGVLWTSINLAALGLFWAWARAERGSSRRSRLGAVLWMPVGLALIYLPCYVTFTEQRFFYVTLPLFFAALASWANASSPAVGLAWRWRQCLVWGCVGLPLLAQVFVLGNRAKFAGDWAHEQATRMHAAQLTGPLAGSASLPGGRTGLYVAFHLQQPWHGDKPAPTPAEIAVSGAKYFLVRRDSPLAAELQADARFRNRDDRLFESPAVATNCPVQVFEIVGREN